MSSLSELHVVAVALAATLAVIAVWAPRRLWIKASAVAVTIGFMPVAYAGMTDLLSKPKPVRLEWVRQGADSALVLAAQLRENKGIYLWLQMEGNDEPRYYKLPWDRDMAKQLQKAMGDAEEGKTGLGMRMPFEESLDPEEPRFYPLPQPKMPDKDGDGSAGEGPTMYRHPGFNA